MEQVEGHVKNICYVNQMEVVRRKFVQYRDHLVMEQVEEHANMKMKYVLVMARVKVSNYSNLSKIS